MRDRRSKLWAEIARLVLKNRQLANDVERLTLERGALMEENARLRQEALVPTFERILQRALTEPVEVQP